jgi:hypothetical protein
MDARTKNEIDHIIDWLDTLGYMVRKEIIDKDLSVDVFGGVTSLRCWYKLARFIIEERDERGYYAENFEGLVRCSIQYFQHAGKTVKLNKVDLVDYFNKNNLMPRTFDAIVSNQA